MNKTYYSTVMFFQGYSEEAQELTKLLNEYHSDMALVYAEQWDEGQDNELTDCTESAAPLRDERTVAEDTEYALVFNDICGDYSLKRKLTQEQFAEEDMRLDGKLTEMLNQNIR